MQAFGSRKPGLATLISRPPRLCGSIDNGPERRTPFQRLHQPQIVGSATDQRSFGPSRCKDSCRLPDLNQLIEPAAA